MQKKRWIQNSLFLSFVANLILLMQILPETNAKYVERISYTIRKETKANIEEYHFSYQESEDEFIAPYTGYYAVQLWGADGGSGAMQVSSLVSFNDQQVGGKGGYIVAQIYMKRGECLDIRVGGTNITDSVTRAGYNAGENGGIGSFSQGGWVSPSYAGGGGGGATDIRINGERVLVAGGGGGGGSRDWASGHVGGDGGYAAEDEYADGMKGGTVNSGGGGTLIAGGEGWNGDNRNSNLDGGLERGGTSAELTGNSGVAGGAGGGGGYYGGGASGAAYDAGGGGSSVRKKPMEAISAIQLTDLPATPLNEVTGGRPTLGTYAKHGYVIISYLDPGMR